MTTGSPKARRLPGTKTTTRIMHKGSARIMHEGQRGGTARRTASLSSVADFSVLCTPKHGMHSRSSIINRRADRGRSDTCNESHKLISERVDPFTSRHFTFVLRAPVQSPAPRLPATNSIQSLHPTPLDTTHSASSGCATIPPHLKQQ